MTLPHILLAILVAAIWGCNFIFIKLGVHEVPPLFLCATRFFFACFPAILFIKPPKIAMKWVILYGLIMFALQFSLMFSSFSAGMTAGMASLIGQTQIFFGVFFAVLFLGEAPTRWQVVGALIAFSGIIVVASHLDAQVTLHGLELVISAAAAWGLGTLLVKKMGKINMIALIVWGSFIACFPLFIISFLVEGQASIIYSVQHVSWLAIISLLYIVYASTWVGYGVWNWLISHYPVTLVVPFTLLIPIFGLLSSVIFVGEQLESWKVLASFLVISGLCINLIGPKIFVRRKKQTAKILSSV